MHIVVARVPVSILQEYRELYVSNLVKFKTTRTEKSVRRNWSYTARSDSHSRSNKNISFPNLPVNSIIRLAAYTSMQYRTGCAHYSSFAHFQVDCSQIYEFYFFIFFDSASVIGDKVMTIFRNEIDSSNHYPIAPVNVAFVLSTKYKNKVRVSRARAHTRELWIISTAKLSEKHPTNGQTVHLFTVAPSKLIVEHVLNLLYGSPRLFSVARVAL